MGLPVDEEVVLPVEDEEVVLPVEDEEVVLPVEELPPDASGTVIMVAMPQVLAPYSR